MKFIDKNEYLKLQDLDRLHKLQVMYCGFADISIETRKDIRMTCVSICSYTEEFARKSKLSVHKLSWDADNEAEIRKIEKELEKLVEKY